MIRTLIQIFVVVAFFFVTVTVFSGPVRHVEPTVSGARVIVRTDDGRFHRVQAWDGATTFGGPVDAGDGTEMELVVGGIADAPTSISLTVESGPTFDTFDTSEDAGSVTTVDILMLLTKEELIGHFRACLSQDDLAVVESEARVKDDARKTIEQDALDLEKKRRDREIERSGRVLIATPTPTPRPEDG